MVYFSSNATEIIDAFNVTITRLSIDGEKLLEKISREAKRVARSLSNGSKSFDDMRRAGHPYRWGGGAYGEAWRINKHSGSSNEFYDGWEIVKGTGKTSTGKSRAKEWWNQYVPQGDISTTYSLVNNTMVSYSGSNFSARKGHPISYSAILSGTIQSYPRKDGSVTIGGMQERPIMDEVYRRIEPKMRQMVRELGEKVGRTWGHTPMRSRHPGMGLNRTPL